MRNTIFLILLFILSANVAFGAITIPDKTENYFNDTFTYSSKIDMDSTTAVWNNVEKMIISRRDFNAIAFPVDQIIKPCNAQQLKTDLNLDIEYSLTCARLGNDVYISGFLPRNSTTKLYNGKIYYYDLASANFNAVLLTNESDFSGNSIGSLIIGAKPNKELLVVYILNSNRDTTVWTRDGGIWRKILDKPLLNFNFKTTTKIVWSGKTWFMSSGNKELKYLKDNVLIDVYNQIPELNFIITHLFGNADNTFVIAGVDKAINVTDKGYSNISILESKEIISSKEIDEAVIKKSIINTPSGTNINFFLSNDNGVTYYPFKLGSIGGFKYEGKKLRYMAELISNGTNTAEIKEIGISYISKETSYNNDNKRVDALKTANKTLSQYNKDFKYYPVNIFNSDPEQSWQQFKNIIDIAENLKRKKYTKIPDQPITNIYDFKYHIKTDAIGQNYVLWTKLENEKSTLLNSGDTDGNILNINCDDPIYCLTNIKEVIITAPTKPLIEKTVVKKTDVVKKEPTTTKKISNTVIKEGSVIPKPGSLIRENGKDPIYFITPQGFKKHILNEVVLNSYKGNIGNIIQIVDKKTLKKYPDVKLIQVLNKPEIYFLEKNKKRLIPTQEIFEAHGFKTEDIVFINEIELKIYETGKELPLKKPGSLTRVWEFFTSFFRD